MFVYVCGIFPCVCNFIVCIGMYIRTHVHFCVRLQRLAVARFFACNHCGRFIAVLSFAPVSITFAAYLFPFSFSRFSRIVSRVHAVTFAVRLSKRFQGSFQTVFRAVLGGLIVWRVHLHRLPYFVRLNSLICGKFADLGVG